MGEKQNRPFHFSFNSSLKVDFQGSRITSGAGLLLVRELDERLGLNQLISGNLTDNRRGKNTQLPLPDLLRQWIYSRVAGYEDLNDAERLSNDPTFRLIGSEKIRDRGAALPSRLHRFETKVLTQAANLSGLASCRGVVPSVGLHRDQHTAREPEGRPLLQPARQGRAMDQGGQAGG